MSPPSALAKQNDYWRRLRLVKTTFTTWLGQSVVGIVCVGKYLKPIAFARGERHFAGHTKRAEVSADIIVSSVSSPRSARVVYYVFGVCAAYLFRDSGDYDKRQTVLPQASYSRRSQDIGHQNNHGDIKTVFGRTGRNIGAQGIR